MIITVVGGMCDGIIFREAKARINYRLHRRRPNDEANYFFILPLMSGEITFVHGYNQLIIYKHCT